jgi:GxxExxY protein
MEVDKNLGRGFLESVYQEALQKALEHRAIPFQLQDELSVVYKGRKPHRGFIADLVAFDQVIIELKAVESFMSAHEGQVINYLKATGYPAGLLINFGARQLNWRRMVRTLGD